MRDNYDEPAVPAAKQEEILRARAHALAREPEDAGAAGGQMAVVEFQLSNERYAVELSHVREVHPLKDLTPVPCTPAFVFGIINVRGKILAVIDIREFFELPKKGISDLNKVVIIQDREMELGILADQIIGVHSIALSDIQPSLPTLTGIRAEFLRGITGDRLVIFDACKLLSDENIIVREQPET